MNGMTRRNALLGAAGLTVAGFGGFDRLFAPRARLWERWTPRRPGAAQTIDHSAWDALLARYLTDDPIRRFRYAAVSAADRAALQAYLRLLGAAPVADLDRPEQFAFWVNLYNALTVELILERRPAASIRDLPRPWDTALIAVAGTELTLNDIEHRILRPIWRDPRIHYGVNCASLGCPSLPAQAFTAARNEALLDQGATAFINGHGLRFAGDRLIVSSIYAWFADDFGGDAAGILAHLRRYAAPALAARLQAVSDIASHEYDWRLNAAG